jgi:hypothetical protein
MILSTHLHGQPASMQLLQQSFFIVAFALNDEFVPNEINLLCHFFPFQLFQQLFTPFKIFGRQRQIHQCIKILFRHW